MISSLYNYFDKKSSTPLLLVFEIYVMHNLIYGNTILHLDLIYHIKCFLSCCVHFYALDMHMNTKCRLHVRLRGHRLS